VKKTLGNRVAFLISELGIMRKFLPSSVCCPMTNKKL